MPSSASAAAKLGRALATWLVLGATGCQVLAGLTERSAGQAPCVHNSDCASDQACLFRVCAPRCIKDVDCANARCLDTDNGNACVSASLASCAEGQECPSGSVCRDGACRTPCDNASPCRSDQVCTDSVCVGTDRSHDPEAAPSAMGGTNTGGSEGDPGGAPAEGGSANGGSVTAGSGGSQVTNGGSDMGGSGGSAMAGSGGAAMAGSGGSAGSGGTDSNPSTGCNTPPGLSSGPNTLTSSDEERSYVLDVPTDYDQTTPYRLVIAWHPIGSSGAVIAAGTGEVAAVGPFYGLKERATDGTIFVAPQAFGTTWAANSAMELTLARDLAAELEINLCIDRDRIFSVGWSVGGAMSVAVGCSIADVFRATAAINGNTQFVGCAAGTTPIAYWAAHGNAVMPAGTAARDTFVQRNHCSDETVPADDPCVVHQGCDTGYPVQWCPFTGNDTIPPFAPASISSFFAQF